MAFLRFASAAQSEPSEDFAGMCVLSLLRAMGRDVMSHLSSRAALIEVGVPAWVLRGD